MSTDRGESSARRKARTRLKAKDCVGCDKHKQAMKSSSAELKIKDARFIDVIKKYGAIGILRLSSAYFTGRYKEAGQEVHKEIAILMRNFEEVMKNRIKKLVTQEEYADIERNFEFNAEQAGACETDPVDTGSEPAQ